MSSAGSSAQAAGLEPVGQRHTLLLVVVAGFLLRAAIAFYALRDPLLPRELDDYIGLAQTWITGGAYPTTLFPPVYPFLCRVLLEVLGSVPQAVTALLILQMLTGTFCIWLSAATFKAALPEVSISRPNAPLVAAALVAVDPMLLQQGQLVLTESIYTVLLLTAVYVLVVTRQRIGEARAGAAFALTGALFGLASLTRSVGVVALIPALLLVWWAPASSAMRRASMAVVFGASFALVLGLWSWHNYQEFDRFSISSSGSYNMAALMVGPAKSIAEGKQPQASLEIWRDELGPELAAFDGRNGFPLADRASEVAVSWARAHPVSVLTANVTGQALILLGPGLASWSELLGLEQKPVARQLLVVAISGFRALMLLLACVGLYSLMRRTPADARTGVCLALLVVLHVGVSGSGYSRFSSPLVPYLDMLAALGAFSALSAIRGRVARPA